MTNNEMITKALTTGFTNAAELYNLKLQCQPHLREYCNPQGCPNHGNNWVCPPGCGSLEDCARTVSRFDAGILLQSVSKLAPNTTNEDYKVLTHQHNLRLQTFLETHCSDAAAILALTTGGCVFCDTCAFPQPCRKPNLRMNSLSAYGIDVGKLCELAGFDYAFSSDKLYLIALVLLS